MGTDETTSATPLPPGDPSSESRPLPKPLPRNEKGHVTAEGMRMQADQCPGNMGANSPVTPESWRKRKKRG